MTSVNNCAPVMPGIRMSVTTTSKGCFSINARAPRPLVWKEVSHSFAIGSNRISKHSKMAGSSSTNRILRFVVMPGSLQVIKERLAQEFGSALQGGLISVLGLSQTDEGLRQVRVGFFRDARFQRGLSAAGDGGRGFQPGLHGAVVADLGKEV